MNVVLFGATGMAGAGALQKCLAEPQVQSVIAITRSRIGRSHRKLREVLHAAAVNPHLTFCYISGAGTDSTERGRTMWARVKGKTENARLALPFKAAYMFRPGYIQPVGGVRSKTRWYQAFYSLAAPLYPVFHWLAPQATTTTANLGRALIRVAANGYPTSILHSRDINIAAATSLAAPDD